MMCKTGLYGKRISIWVIQGLVQGIVTMKNPFRGSMTVQTKMAQLRMILLPTIGIAHIIDAWRETMTMMITAKRNRKSFARCRVLNPQGMWRPNLKQMS